MVHPTGEAPSESQEKKGHLSAVVSFSNASEVSCRARAEEDGPTPVVGDSPLGGSPVAFALGDLRIWLYAIPAAGTLPQMDLFVKRAGTLG
jgi:hypothetical protein